MTQTNRNNNLIPLAFEPVHAGFPSPADDFLDKSIDMNEFLIKHPAATYFVRAEGNSMINSGIFSGDILVVDKSLEPSNNSIVIASIDGEFTVKKFVKKNHSIFLKPSNGKFRKIQITKDCEFEIWGVVTFVIHQIK
ncbi:translesion error-prone DNA polymerase V autoproteolytic subunit [Candidatus Dojkabacteria bacterium]|nr:translesion error-prone DNA polymerase V autoproteolytic subunit [Candidatus Dojkabacteria bacterium]